MQGRRRTRPPSAAWVQQILFIVSAQACIVPAIPSGQASQRCRHRDSISECGRAHGLLQRARLSLT